jgi:hypothetical protein
MLVYLELGLLILVDPPRLSLLSMMNDSWSGGIVAFKISDGLVESLVSDSLPPSSTVGKSVGPPVFSMVSVIVGKLLRMGHSAQTVPMLLPS